MLIAPELTGCMYITSYLENVLKHKNWKLMSFLDDDDDDDDDDDVCFKLIHNLLIHTYWLITVLYS